MFLSKIPERRELKNLLAAVDKIDTAIASARAKRDELSVRKDAAVGKIGEIEAAAAARDAERVTATREAAEAMFADPDAKPTESVLARLFGRAKAVPEETAQVQRGLIEVISQAVAVADDTIAALEVDRETALEAYNRARHTAGIDELNRRMEALAKDLIEPIFAIERLRGPGHRSLFTGYPIGSFIEWRRMREFVSPVNGSSTWNIVDALAHREIDAPAILAQLDAELRKA